MSDSKKGGESEVRMAMRGEGERGRGRVGFVGLVAGLLLVGLAILPSAQGSSPTITYIDFPEKIQAGESVPGHIFFEDPDGDVTKVEFELVEGERSSLEIRPDWEFDPGVEGEEEGVIEFQVMPKVSQQITLKVTLFDGLGNSGSSEFSFEIVGNEPPVAKFTFSPPKPRVGEPVRFDGSESEDPDGSIVSWSWDFGDGSSGSGMQTTHTYSSEGSYTVTLQVTDNKGASSSASKTVEVLKPNQPPVAIFTYSPSDPEVGEQVTFDASGSYDPDPDGEIVSYEWDFDGDGEIDAQGVRVTHRFTAPGPYQVTLTVTDDGGLSDSASQTVQVRPKPKPPVAEFTYSPSEPRPEQSVEFDASGSYDPDGRIVKYEWSFGDGSTGSGKIVYHSYTSAGSYYVTLKVTDDDGLTGSTSKIITVVPPPPVARFTASPTSGPAPLTVRFTNLSEHYTSSLWDFGDGTTSTLTNPIHTYLRAGEYTVTLTVRGPGGEDSASQLITVTWPEGVLYQDDFSDPGSGWPSEDWRGYEDGEYFIIMEEAGWWGGSTIPGEPFFDAFCVEVEVRAVGRVKGAYGILFGFKDWDNNYSFAVHTDGWFLVDRMVEGHWIQRARWRESPAIKKGTATNRLKIIVDEGRNMYFYINDQPVKTMLSEVTYEGGEIGIYAWAFKDGFQANFDYIKVMEVSKCTP